MEEKYLLEKEYTVKPELFSEAYKAYQKKFVLKKSYLFMGLFLFLAADFVYAAIKAPDNRLVYLLIVVCLAFAYREWRNPRFIRMRLTETVAALGEPVYSIGVGEEFIDISTVKEPEYEREVYLPEEMDGEEAPEKAPGETEEEDGEEAEGPDLSDIPEELDPLPEKSRIAINEDYQSLEYDRFFLLVQGKQTFYIIPKEGFTDKELEIIRNTGKRSA